VKTAGKHVGGATAALIGGDHAAVLAALEEFVDLLGEMIFQPCNG
jgi:hypothetical protein